MSLMPKIQIIFLAYTLHRYTGFNIEIVVQVSLLCAMFNNDFNSVYEFIVGTLRVYILL